MRPSKLGMLGQIACNAWRSTWQDGSLFKTNAAMFLSYGQASVRSIIASGTSRQAAKEGDAEYARHEMAKTIYREFGGATAQYGILKVMETALSLGLERFFGAEKIKEGVTGPIRAIQDAWGVLFQDKIIKKMPHTITGEVTFAPFNKATAYKHQGFLLKVAHWAEKNLPANWNMTGLKPGMSDLKRAEEGFRLLHGWLPVLVGTVGGIFVAGWLLERSNLKYGEQIVDFLSGTRKGQQPPKASNTEALTPVVIPNPSAVKPTLTPQALALSQTLLLQQNAPYKQQSVWSPATMPASSLAFSRMGRPGF